MNLKTDLLAIVVIATAALANQVQPQQGIIISPREFLAGFVSNRPINRFLNNLDLVTPRPSDESRTTRRRCTRRDRRRGLCRPRPSEQPEEERVDPVTPSQNRTNIQSGQSENIEQLRNAIEIFINDEHEMIPNLLQLVFHTCIGGCDGCINENEPANKGFNVVFEGLKGTYATIREFWNSHASILTLADTIVLMASEAIEIGMALEEGTAKVDVPFRSGRRTCDNPDQYLKEFVFPHGEGTDDVDQLQTEFGLSRKLAIALLGAHSVGRCHRENSGFAGRWDNTELVLDNHYYKSLTGTDWKPTVIAGKQQWNATRRANSRMMLNSDLALLKDFTINPNNRPSCASAKKCDDSSDASQVKFYAKNSERWREDFIEAFLLMVNKGI